MADEGPGHIAARVEAVAQRASRAAERAFLVSGPDAEREQRWMLRLLEDADERLFERLDQWMAANGGDTASFTPASIVAYRNQVQQMVGETLTRMNGRTVATSGRAWELGSQHLRRDLEDLERIHRGVARIPRIRQAMKFSPTRGRSSSVIRSIETSFDRYGDAMTREFERTMALGFTAGLSQHEMVELLTGHGGPTGEVSMRARVVNGSVVRTMTEQIPEGLFRRYRSWAWRIVRTETSNAYNAAKVDTLLELRESIPGLKKKILAHFDVRTASDSVAVHGQIRDLDGPNSFFLDGAGRSYEHPPARPNDRETVIPWEDEWPDTPSTRQLTQAEINEADQAIAGGRPVFDPATQRAHDIEAEQRAADALEREAIALGKRTRAPRAPRTPRTTPTTPPARERFAPGMSRAELMELHSGLRVPPTIERQTLKLTTADQRRIRTTARELVATRTGMEPPVERIQPLSVDLQVQHASDAYGTHSWFGSVRINPHVARESNADLLHLVEGTVSETSRTGLRTVIHEEVHGFSPIANLLPNQAGARAYRGLGVMVEEVCTEATARSVMTGLQVDAASVAADVASMEPAAAATTRAQIEARARFQNANVGGYQWTFDDLYSTMRGAIGSETTKLEVLQEILQETARTTWSNMRRGGSPERRAMVDALRGSSAIVNYWHPQHPGRVYFEQFAGNLERSILSRYPNIPRRRLDLMRVGLERIAQARNPTWNKAHGIRP